ncbi:MAG: acyl-CoA carboxylase subunit beta, partial [Bacteroidetes bacterium]|nr:acyl-CoA carboxylase subunit beta [Bacteroidota bacterium]
MPQDLEFNRNEDNMRLLLQQLEHEHSKIKKGGGDKAIAKQREQGKLLARERIEFLCDKDTEFFEIGAFTAYDMYKEYGGCPSAGVITGIGTIKGRQCMIVANDATVKAGAWFPMSGKKNLRAQEIAMENKLPIIYLVDSAGV